jgi:hypothetical protein
LTPEEELDAFLEHHGVKGMHWGVRREKETSEHRQYRKTTVKGYRKETNEAVYRRVQRVYGDSTISKEAYNKLSDKDVRYREGHTLSRVTKDPELDKSKKAIFVSTNQKDAIRYRSVLADQNKPIKQLFLSGNHKYDGFQETTFKASEALVGPSEKARVDAFVKLLDSPTVKLANGKTITGKQYLKRAGLAPDIKRLDSQRAGLKYYNTFLQYQWKDTPINSAYFDSLRSQGYNFVTDDNDRTVLTKDPIIILNPSGSVKQMKVRTLTTDDILKAQGKYTDINSTAKKGLSWSPLAPT